MRGPELRGHCEGQDFQREDLRMPRKQSCNEELRCLAREELEVVAVSENAAETSRPFCVGVEDEGIYRAQGNHCRREHHELVEPPLQVVEKRQRQTTRGAQREDVEATEARPSDWAPAGKRGET